MSMKFRNELLESNNEFKKVFNELINKNEIYEFDDKIKDIILRDRTSIKINNEPYSLKDLFHLDLTEGRCEICARELVLLLDKLGIYSEAVKCTNEYFVGTSGSVYGGHWYVQAIFDNSIKCIDTSLEIMGDEEAFNKLGHKIVKKYDIDTLFKENSELIEYYDNMIINKNLL